ncbi:MAG: vorC [Geobacteraceae bacterium]|nr:vorC [Geobacteraceae bacterium]
MEQAGTPAYKSDRLPLHKIDQRSPLMRYDLLIAGFGGQGALLAGTVLCYAAMIEGKNVSYLPSYGPEKRGGAAMCTVVITDGDVGSPVVGNPSVGILLNQLSLEKYGPRIKPGGICIVNSSLADTSHINRTDIEIFEMPMNEIAMGIGDARLVNMVALGAYAAKTGAVGEKSLEMALKDALPERNHKYIPVNIKAIEAGVEIIRKALAGENPAEADSSKMAEKALTA